MLKKIVLSGVLVAVSATLAASQSKAVTKRVTLSKARPCTVLSGSVQPKSFDTYIFRAVKGQSILASPYYYGKETNRPKDDEQGLSGFVMVVPGGERWEDPQDDQFTAEKTGEYKLLVRPAYRRTTGKYDVMISVTNKPRSGVDDPNKPPKCS